MPKIDYKKKDNGTKWAIACNPVAQEYHSPTRIDKGTRMSSGWPVIVYADTAEAVCELVFSSYTLDDDGNLRDYTPRDLKVSVGYTSESEAKQVTDDAQEEVEGYIARPIKHPAREEWATVYQSHMFGEHGRRSGKRQGLVERIATQASSGRHRNPSTARSQGWK